jgi:hypothetical protein
MRPGRQNRGRLFPYRPVREALKYYQQFPESARKIGYVAGEAEFLEYIYQGRR